MTRVCLYLRVGVLGVIVGLAVGSLNGCTGFREYRSVHQLEDLPPRVEIEAVPFYSQQKYQCGPSSLAMALSWSGLPTSPEDLVPEVYSPAKRGSLQAAMLAAVRRHGRIAYEIAGLEELLSELTAGHPVIVLQNLGLSWYPIWHYAVVVGYDLPADLLILHSGTIARKQTSLKRFEKTWARASFWGLCTLAPNQLPATANERRFIEAVYGLEKADHYRAAIVGYETALNRWPQSLAAVMGLGNSHYATGDLQSAENTFRHAVRLHPTSGAAFNNLAQSLLEQGKTREALLAAETAVSLGGPLNSIYQKTLKEIQSAAE